MLVIKTTRGPPNPVTKAAKSYPSGSAKRKGRRECSLMENRAGFQSHETTWGRMFRFTESQHNTHLWILSRLSPRYTILEGWNHILSSIPTAQPTAGSPKCVLK